MTKFAVVVVITILIFCAVRATAQQHAPTKKQCDADANLWSVTDLNNSDLHISIKELGARDREMAACMFAYTPEVLKTSKYDALASWYIFQLHERTQNFIRGMGCGINSSTKMRQGCGNKAPFFMIVHRSQAQKHSILSRGST